MNVAVYTFPFMNCPLPFNVALLDFKVRFYFFMVKPVHFFPLVVGGVTFDAMAREGSPGNAGLSQVPTWAGD